MLACKQAVVPNQQAADGGGQVCTGGGSLLSASIDRFRACPQRGSDRGTGLPVGPAGRPLEVGVLGSGGAGSCRELRPWKSHKPVDAAIGGGSVACLAGGGDVACAEGTAAWVHGAAAAPPTPIPTPSSCAGPRLSRGASSLRPLATPQRELLSTPAGRARPSIAPGSVQGRGEPHRPLWAVAGPQPPWRAPRTLLASPCPRGTALPQRRSDSTRSSPAQQPRAWLGNANRGCSSSSIWRTPPFRSLGCPRAPRLMHCAAH